MNISRMELQSYARVVCLIALMPLFHDHRIDSLPPLETSLVPRILKLKLIHEVLHP